MNTPVPGWCTNWAAYNVPRLWAMVADEDAPESWRQVAALGDVTDAVRDQRARLVRARDALAQAWPPEQNPAAEAFLIQVDTLLHHLDANQRAAAENAAALGHILEALRQAKQKVQPLYEQYLDKTDDLVPEWWDHAAEELDEQARQHLIEAERVVAAHAGAIVVPDPYRLEAIADFAGSADLVTGDGAGGVGVHRDVVVPHEPPPPLPGRSADVPERSSLPPPVGVGLAGINPVPSAVPVPLPPPVAQTIPSAGGSPGLVITPGGLPPLSAAPWPAPGRPGPVRGAGAGPVGGAGIFGARPGAAVGSGQAGGRPTPPSWLPQGSGRAGSGAGTQPRTLGREVAGLPPGYGGRPAPRDNDDRPGGFTVDSPWATAEGVSPVIEPSRRSTPHDPGPNVIGWPT